MRRAITKVRQKGYTTNCGACPAGRDVPSFCNGAAAAAFLSAPRITMKSIRLLVSIAVAMLLATASAFPQEANKEKKSSEAGPLQTEALTESNLTRLSKDDSVWIDTKRKLVVVDGEVAIRDGFLEMFACPQGTKEHESLVAVYSKAYVVHTGLLAVGAVPGQPVRFNPQYRPVEGPVMRVDGLIFADDVLIEQIRVQTTRRPSRWPTSPRCRASRTPASPCPTSTGATASASAASARPIRRRAASSRPAASATTSTAACAWCAPISSIDVKPHPQADRSSCFRTSRPAWARGSLQVRQGRKNCAADGEGPLLEEARAGHRRRHRTHRGRRPPGRRRAGPNVSERALTAAGPVRHARLGQPLPRSAGRRPIFDEEAARAMGLEKDMVCVMIHSGSRGLGYQVCDDALALLPQRAAEVRHRPARPAAGLRAGQQPRGAAYLGAMRAAANFAWCNRQLLMHQAREVFAEGVFGRSWEDGMNLVYDVAHNIAKFERAHDRRRRRRCGSTARGRRGRFRRAIPRRPMYRTIGQPVIIPGDMGRASWVLVGQPGSMEQTFGTTCHGAGRMMSRTAAVKQGRPSRPPHRQGAGGQAASSPAPRATRAWPRSSPKRTRTSTWWSTWSTSRPGAEGGADAADRGAKRLLESVAGPALNPGARRGRSGRYTSSQPDCHGLQLGMLPVHRPVPRLGFLPIDVVEKLFCVLGFAVLVVDVKGVLVSVDHHQRDGHP
jgi:hypothetical protein